MQALAHQRRGQAMREALDMQQTSSWREFQAVASVLIAAGALELDTYRVSLPCSISPVVHHCRLMPITCSHASQRHDFAPHACGYDFEKEPHGARLSAM